MNLFIQNWSEKKLALTIIFLISFIYLFPAVLGYVDTPFDIRNIRMYPWRYHALDEKVKNVTVWSSNLRKEYSVIDPETKAEVISLEASPGKANIIPFQTNWDLLIKNSEAINDINCFVGFDFKNRSNVNVTYDLGVSVINNLTNVSFTPGAGITPLVKHKDGIVTWYRAYFPLNNFLAGFKNKSDLRNYSLQLILKSTSQADSAKVYVKDLKLAYEDFSAVNKVHNHYNNDLIQMFTPLREFFGKALKSGKLPFWNNYILCGAEFLAEPQVGFFHPLYFLSYLIFDHFTAHEFITFICFFLGGFGAFLLARFWQLSFCASLLTALVYMFQPFNVTWFSYEHMLMNSAVFPYLLMSFDKSIRENQPINKHLIFSALILGLIFISGHLQYVYYTAVFFILFAGFRIFSQKKNILKNLFRLLFILSFGVLIGGIVIVPFLDLFKASHRAVNPESLVRATSFPFQALEGLVYPFYKGYPAWPLSGEINVDPAYVNYKMAFARNYVYFGLLPFVFFLISLGCVSNSLVLFLLGIILFSFLISMGSPLFFLLREILPGFKEMQHYRFLQLYSYCVPFLAGFGFQALWNWLGFLKQKTKTILFIVIFLISVFDLGYFSFYFVTWSKRSDYKPLQKNGVLGFLADEKKKSKEHFRILPFVSHKIEGASLKPDIAEPNTLLPYELEDVSGYSSFIPKDIYYSLVYIQTMDAGKLYSGDIFDLFSNINTPYPISNFHSMILDLLNVKYFVVPNFITIDSEKVEKVFEGDCTVYKNKKCFPRAFFVENYKVIKEPKDIIVELEKADFNARKEVILDEEPFVGDVKRESFVNTVLESELKSIEYNQNQIILKAHINKPGFLILGNNLNNNWKVKINGKEDKHYEANLLQRAVYLEKAGDYIVEFYYYPGRFLFGLLISGSGVLILFILGLWLFLRKR